MNTKSFDIAEHLESDDDIRQFLEEVTATGDTSDLIHALNIAARAKGVSEIAKQSGVTRASLYKSLSEHGNPHLDTISKIAGAFGCRLILVR